MRFTTLAATILALGTPGVAGADTLTINLGNNSWATISGVAVRPAGNGDYVTFDLPENGLGAGDFADLALPDGETICTYDLRFTKADGSQHERLGLNLCAETYYHFADE